MKTHRMCDWYDKLIPVDTFRAVAGLPPGLRWPTGITESTRWLFAALALLTLLVEVPAQLFSGGAAVLILVSVATVALAYSVVHVYLSRGVPPGLDVLDALALGVLTMTSANSNAPLGCLFTAVWFRASYGTTWRSLLRCAMYAVGVGAGIALWPTIHRHEPVPGLDAMVGMLPLLLVVLGVARWLHSGLMAREEGLRRNAALGVAGSLLVGATDRAAISEVGWAAATEICAATPGLRVVKAVLDGEIGRVERVAGDFAAPPAQLPAAIFLAGAVGNDVPILDTFALDAAAGAPLAWVCTTLAAYEAHTWLFIGAPKRIQVEALLAVHSLVNQTGQALRTARARQELRVQAGIDLLTGLANRAAFMTTLATHLDQRAPGVTSHVLVMDLDEFKGVNDVLGHQAGDELLMEVARRLNLGVRSVDLCARLGGDEFAVVLRGLEDAAVAEAARRLVDAVAAPVHLGTKIVRTSISIGVAAGAPGVGVEQLVHQANVAMQAAKAHGTGRITFFDPSLLAASVTQLSMERQLASAVTAGELVVHYQPILGLPDLRCIGAEALVRWLHPEHGLLQPSDFIDLAERTGAIVEIGDFVLRRACADVVSWQRLHPDSPLAIHVNVSANQLEDEHFIDTVIGALAENGLAAHCLVLELTETVMLDSPAAIARLKHLAAAGVQIAIDDFGTGYASLTTLRALPVSVIKLDASFIAGALTNPVDKLVIDAISQLSNKLGLQTVAEGVEGPDEQRLLRKAGINAVQGQLYLRAVPAAAFGDWLEENLGGTIPLGSNVVPFRPPLRAG